MFQLVALMHLSSPFRASIDSADNIAYQIVRRLSGANHVVQQSDLVHGASYRAGACVCNSLATTMTETAVVSNLNSEKQENAQI